MKASKIMLILTVLASMLTIGCDGMVADNVDGNANVSGEGNVKSGDKDGNHGDDDENRGMLEQASDLFDQAAKSGGDNARKAKEWLQDKFNDAYDSSSQIADDTSGWVNDTYKSLKEKGLTTADSAKQWLSDDIQSMGAWEYKVIKIGKDEASEVMERQLNDFGKLRWECFQVVESGDSMKLMFKRSKRSYLKNVPLRDLMKLVPLMGGGGGESE